MHAALQRLKIISGGQPGVGRAALDVGLALGLTVGGGCPRGRCAVSVFPACVGINRRYNSPARGTSTVTSFHRPARRMAHLDRQALVSM